MNFTGIMEKVKEMQERLKESQKNLPNITVSGESGGGMVKATANGLQQIISLEIDAALLKAEDKQVLEDLTVAAVNKALAAAGEVSKKNLKEVTQGIPFDIPGLNFTV